MSRLLTHGHMETKLYYGSEKEKNIAICLLNCKTKF